MFTSRRAIRAVEPDGGTIGADDWNDDRLAELADLVGGQTGQGGRSHSPASTDDLADALAADLDRLGDDLTPVHFDERRPARGFDPWDDAALQDLADELGDYEDFEPARTPEGVLPPHPLDEEAAAPPSRRRGLMLTAAAVVLMLGGGALAYVLLTGSGGIGAPSLVRAPTGPFKVVPEAGDTLGEPAEPNLVFNGNAMPAKGEERLVTRPGDVPDLPGVTPQVNRVILPDGQEIAPEPAQPAETGPRRVRTVLVKPDGTIIESPDGPVPSLPTPTETSLLEPSSLTDPTALAPAEDAPSAAGLPPLPEVDQVVAPVSPVPAITLPAEVTPTVEAALPTPTEAAPTPTEALLPPLPGEPVATGPAPTPPNRPSPVAADPVAPVAEATAQPEAGAPRAVAPVRAPKAQGGPLDLAAAASAPPAAAVAAPVAAAPVAATPASGAGAFVQVSSQRSESAALSAFQSLQRKHPDLLAGVQPDVQRADLGAKGVYYRARIPSSSRDAAADLCAKLRAAGVDCLLARN